jgi:hypothetical protein
MQAKQASRRDGNEKITRAIGHGLQSSKEFETSLSNIFLTMDVSFDLVAHHHSHPTTTH